MANPIPEAGFRSIRLLTNHFEITQLPTGEYHQYEDFNPPCPIRNKRAQLFFHMQMNVAADTFNPRVLYDGRSIVYAPKRLKLANNGSGTFNVRLGTPGPADPAARGTFQIRLTLTTGGKINATHVYDLIQNRQSTMRAQVATNLIQLIVRQHPNMYNTNNGRAYFMGDEKKVLPGSGLELWRGTFQSIRPTIGKMILNVDTCTAAVYQGGDLLNICMDKIRSGNARDLDLQEWESNFKTLETFLKGVRITIKITGGRSRVKTIRGLFSRAGAHKFIRDDTHEEVTVASHFAQVHNIPIEHPSIVGVRLTSKNNPHQDIVPLEVCKIEHGQFFKRKIPEELTSEMVKFSTLKPNDRLEKIKKAAQYSVRSEFVEESGMKLRMNPMEIDAKLLEVPSLYFHSKRSLHVKDGAWNTRNQHFNAPAVLEYWMVISFVHNLRSDDIRNKMTASNPSLVNSCTQLGMKVSTGPFVVPNANGHAVEKAMSGSIEQYGLQVGVPRDTFLRKLMVIVILPNNGASIRSAVKHWGDVTHGVATQCLREAKLKKPNDQYWNNIALKLNARLGGRNFLSLSGVINELKVEPFMIMGADVGHPGPGVQRPSVAGLVYSHDRYSTQYHALTGIQPPRLEQILDLRRFVVEAVEGFATKNTIKNTVKNVALPPKRLIFFRDGISEGDFDKVASIEIGEIKAAFTELRKRHGFSPPFLTFIIVGKRHHAVFFPVRPSDGDRTGNAHAGSLIDSGVTHPAVRPRDFYLQSHAAIQGTSRSSHYTILLDENWNNDMQKVQQLSYTLCHVYAKATRSVSIPAPVYYADLVCSRGLFHVDPNNKDLVFDDNASSASDSSSNTLDMSLWKTAFKPVHPNLAKSMYFL